VKRFTDTVIPAQENTNNSTKTKQTQIDAPWQMLGYQCYKNVKVFVLHFFILQKCVMVKVI